MGNFFSSVGNAQKQINIPLSWAPFFIVKLLEKDNFMWAKTFLNSSTCQFFQQEDIIQECIPFNIPVKRPNYKAICYSSEMQNQNQMNLSAPQCEPRTLEEDESQSQQDSSTTHLPPRKRK
jgi:hypothetical protein